jgi:DNA phosphorothioation-associated putative methyltransferase
MEYSAIPNPIAEIRPLSILRHKTAIRRYQPSRPVALALDHELIAPGVTVFDYGCGRGDDIRYLRAQGVSAEGWDPHYSPESKLRAADVVNLGYVLNVIENPLERDAVLRGALQLALRLLIVAVRVDQGPQTGEAFNDGLITSRNGFQKLYTQAELRAYLESTLGHQPVMAGLGVAYIFRDETWQSRHLARTSVYRPTFGRQFAIDAFQSSELGAAFLNLARTLARLPRPREFSDFTALCQQFGSAQRISRLATAILDPAYLENLRRQRRDSFLIYYAATRLQGLRLPPFNLLLEETKADILSLWPSFKSAREEGEAFLFSLGNSERVQSSTYRSTVGKIVGDSLYAHRSIVEQLPSLSRLQIIGACRIVGEIEYDIVKLSADGRRVSFLRYPRFEKDAHPALAHSLSVYLPKADYSYRDFSNSENPPILHRKDALVDETYPLHQKFVALTKQEEKKSLLNRPDIGHKQAWERVLEDAGLVIRGHRLFRR